MKNDRWVYYKDVKPQDMGGGVTRRVLAYSDDLMVVENTFEKGAVGSLHHHPHTQITYVASGAFEFEIDGVKNVVRKGDTMLKTNDVIHGCVCLEAGIERRSAAELTVSFNWHRPLSHRLLNLFSAPACSLHACRTIRRREGAVAAAAAAKTGGLIRCILINIFIHCYLLITPFPGLLELYQTLCSISNMLLIENEPPKD